RRRLLLGAGLPQSLVASQKPRGVGADDHVDAMAALVVARDVLLGRAGSLPETPGHDAHGLPVVIRTPERPA
ncbi:DUF429 domain-containing protein, partial [Methylobacterium trifolii]